MVDHIYGRVNLLNKRLRPSMFVSELKMYVDYLKKEMEKASRDLKQENYIVLFKANLLSGIDYYLKIIPTMKLEAFSYLNTMRDELCLIKKELETFVRSLQLRNVGV
jgi:hypothetical protein